MCDIILYIFLVKTNYTNWLIFILKRTQPLQHERDWNDGVRHEVCRRLQVTGSMSLRHRWLRRHRHHAARRPETLQRSVRPSGPWSPQRRKQGRKSRKPNEGRWRFWRSKTEAVLTVSAYFWCKFFLPP